MLDWVQVRHPGVTTLMQRDFTLMHRAAKLSSHLPVLNDLHLEESIRQFGAPLKEQLDLLTEAKHLDRFGRNFRTWHNLSFPAPVYPLVAPSVLVETFEEGRLISSYVDKPTNKYSIHLANIGLSCYLQMLLKDNFVHADLHPGKYKPDFSRKRKHVLLTVRMFCTADPRPCKPPHIDRLALTIS